MSCAALEEIGWYVWEDYLSVLWYSIADSVFDEFVHAQDERTPLLVVAYNGHAKIANILVEKGANIEAMDKVQFIAFVQ